MISGIDLAERGLVPDIILRPAIRARIGGILEQTDEIMAEKPDFLESLGEGPIAISTDAANQQHYEVPSNFFKFCLGPNLKYSCAFYEYKYAQLAFAEEAMFQLYAERAMLKGEGSEELSSNPEFLDLGCGWGSLSLWLASNFPEARITSLSNSSSQKAYIDSEADARGINNIEVITADINEVMFERRFDRVFSIEMFEHMRNYKALLRNLSQWLKPEGKAFIHIFCHRKLTYAFNADAENDWMARHFFAGGIMPSQDIFEYFAEDMKLLESWWVCGKHYSRTAQQWLKNLKGHKHEILALFQKEHAPKEAKKLYNRWRLFFLTCDEFFGYNYGDEWGVGHYLLKPRLK